MGMKMMAANMAAATSKVMTNDTAGMGLAKRRGGKIGSGARRSHHTKTAVATTPNPMRARMMPEPHGYVCPPPRVTSSREGAAPTGGAGTDEEGGAGVVDGVGPSGQRQAQHGARDDQGENADGNVDVEDPTPGQGIHEEF